MDINKWFNNIQVLHDKLLYNRIHYSLIKLTSLMKFKKTYYYNYLYNKVYIIKSTLKLIQQIIGIG